MVNWASPGVEKTRASIPCAIVTVIAYLVLPVLSYAEHAKTVRPSLLLNGFLLISLLCDVVRARSLWLLNKDKIASDFTACVALKCLIFVLEAVEKRHILKPEHQTKSPEATSGIYSRSLFWWLNPLFCNGYRKTFSVDHLYPLDKHLLSGYTHGLLESSWVKSCLVVDGVLLWRRFRDCSLNQNPNALF